VYIGDEVSVGEVIVTRVYRRIGKCNVCIGDEVNVTRVYMC